MLSTLLVAPLAASTAPKGGSSGGGSSPVSLIILVAIVAGAYLLFIRPRMRRQRDAVSQRGKCEVGDEVTTTAGLIATVVAVDDDSVTLEIAPGVRSRYIPAAIMKVNHPEPPERAPSAEDGPIEHEAIEHEAIEHEAIVDPQSDDGSGDKPPTT